MFGIGFTELMVVLVVALIVIGPDKLPAIAKTMGKAFVEFRRVGEDLKKTITDIDLDAPSGPAVKKNPSAKKKTVSPGPSAGDGAKPESQPGKKVT
jgi:sec-independent protein translocase protein TatB